MNNDSTPSLHVVCGAGQIGTQLADLLLALGHRVRIVRRGVPVRHARTSSGSAAT